MVEAKPRAHRLAALLVVVVMMGWSARPCESSLYQPPPPAVEYHGGAVLEGAVPVSVLYYGAFPPHHRAVVADFLLSLSPRGRGGTSGSSTRSARRGQLRRRRWRGDGAPWRGTCGRPAEAAGGRRGARGAGEPGRRRGVLAPEAPVAGAGGAADVAVEGFCSSLCGVHGSSSPGRTVHVWVGDTSAQCPGRCAWPFHAADGYAYDATGRRAHDHGRAYVALGAPNGNAGVDGMVINLAALLAGSMTNPYGRGYFQGDAAAPVEVAAACQGVYGRGAYPGYPGAVRVDAATGAGYNVVGRNGRRYLVPALVDPDDYSSLILT